MARTAEHREAAAAVGARTRRHRGFCRRFTWCRGILTGVGRRLGRRARVQGRRAGGPLNQGSRGRRRVREQRVVCADFKGLGVLPASGRNSLGKERCLGRRAARTARQARLGAARDVAAQRDVGQPATVSLYPALNA
jgi:hypothetical protein